MSVNQIMNYTDLSQVQAKLTLEAVGVGVGHSDSGWGHFHYFLGDKFVFVFNMALH